MRANVGKLDRMMRLLLGWGLIVVALVSDLAVFDDAVLKYVAVAVGIVLATSGLMRTCPMYSIFGIKTCKD